MPADGGSMGSPLAHFTGQAFGQIAWLRHAELFEVEYFDTKAYLAQSPQFFKQMAQPAGFGKVFEIGPAFRADPSFTSRHATEFTSVDAEISWIDSHEDVMKLHEELMVAGYTAVKEKHGAEIEELFGIDAPIRAARIQLSAGTVSVECTMRPITAASSGSGCTLP